MQSRPFDQPSSQAGGTGSFPQTLFEGLCFHPFSLYSIDGRRRNEGFCVVELVAVAAGQQALY